MLTGCGAVHRRELFTAEGNEFYIFPASRYIHTQETLDFYQLLARGRLRQEVRCRAFLHAPMRYAARPPDYCMVCLDGGKPYMFRSATFLIRGDRL